MRTLLFIIALFLTGSLTVFSQNERKLIREGNRKYDGNKFNDSEIAYRKAMEQKPESFEAAFNLGDALYKQGKYEEAASQFQSLSGKDVDKEKLSKVYHNLGNSLLQSKKYEESINAYKKSLVNNPTDMETKFNLAYAQKMIQMQKQQQQQNKDNKDNKQDQKKQEQKQEQKQDQKQDQKKQEQQQQQKEQISKKDAERMLNAMQDDEKKLQEKLKKEQMQRQKKKLEKDW